MKQMYGKYIEAVRVKKGNNCMIIVCRLNRNIPEKRNFLQLNSEYNLFTVVRVCTVHRKLRQPETK